MSAENDILDLAQMIADARDLLKRAADLAVEASGYSGGRQADPANGIPGEAPQDGDPVLLELADYLQDALINVERVDRPKFAEMFRKAREYADEVQDRKDGQSY